MKREGGYRRKAARSWSKVKSKKYLISRFLCIGFKVWILIHPTTLARTSRDLGTSSAPFGGNPKGAVALQAQD